MPKEVTLNQNTNNQHTEILRVHSRTAECAARHIEAFFNQYINKRVADTGEPCANCRHWEICKADWLTNLKPLFDKAGIKLSLCRPKKKETFGLGDSCIEIIQGEPSDSLTEGLSLPY